MNALAEYEDLEEQGLLVRLPCKVGDTVWVVTSPINVFGYDEYDGDAEYEVYESFYQAYLIMRLENNSEFMQK